MFLQQIAPPNISPFSISLFTRAPHGSVLSLTIRRYQHWQTKVFFATERCD